MKQTKADAVVIGSGVGGLTCAARLAAKGMKVTVLERMPFLGGRFSTRIVKGFKIPTGAMIVPFGPNSAFQEAFDLLGTPLKLQPSKAGITYRLPHGDYEPPQGGGGLLGMMKFALRDDAKARELFTHFKHAFTWWEPSYEISFKDWLQQYTDDKNVHGMFQGFCAAFVGVNAYEVPAGEFFRFIKATSTNVEYGMAPEGNIVPMNDLGNAIVGRGGRVEKSAECRAILVENEIVRGVIMRKNGEEETIKSSLVISNTGPAKTVRLAGEANFEKSYLALLRGYDFTIPVVYIAIASTEPLFRGSGVMNFGNTRRLVFLETPTVLCPDLAPKGKHLTITFNLPEQCKGPLNLRETIDMALLDLEENFPSFKSDAEVIHTGAHHGAWPVSHRWPGHAMPIRTPIENLYNVGDGCMPAGTVGLEACALSAKSVAEDIFAGLSRRSARAAKSESAE